MHRILDAQEVFTSKNISRNKDLVMISTNYFNIINVYEFKIKLLNKVLDLSVEISI